MPLAWLIKYDPAKISPDATYAVSARFTDAAGKLLFVNNTQVPVLTRGAPNDDMLTFR